MCDKNPSGILLDPPIVSNKEADSPIIFPAERIKAVKIPGKADGTIKLNITLNLLAPRAKAPLLYEEGTANKDSFVVSIILGKTAQQRVRVPAKIDCPAPNPTQKRLNPNKPKRIEGMLARIFVVKLIKLNKDSFLQYCVRYIEHPTPIGVAIRSVSTTT